LKQIYSAWFEYLLAGILHFEANEYDPAKGVEFAWRTALFLQDVSGSRMVMFGRHRRSSVWLSLKTTLM
jgi:hypothetical protein